MLKVSNIVLRVHSQFCGDFDKLIGVRHLLQSTILHAALSGSHNRRIAVPLQGKVENCGRHHIKGGGHGFIPAMTAGVSGITRRDLCLERVGKSQQV